MLLHLFVEIKFIIFIHKRAFDKNLYCKVIVFMDENLFSFFTIMINFQGNSNTKPHEATFMNRYHYYFEMFHF